MVRTRRNSFSVPSLPPLSSSRPTTTTTTNNNNNNNKIATVTATTITASNHFLRHVNLEECDNVMSIPSPPSPPPTTTTTISLSNRQRRQSLPFLVSSSPFRDLSPNTTTITAAATTESVAMMKMMKKKKKRSRTSFNPISSLLSPSSLHNETPLESTMTTTTMTTNETATTTTTSTTTTTASSSSSVDDDDDDDVKANDDDDGCMWSVIYNDNDDDETVNNMSSSMMMRKRQKRRETMASLPPPSSPPQEVAVFQDDTMKDCTTTTTATIGMKLKNDVARNDDNSNNDDDDSDATQIVVTSKKTTRPSKRRQSIVVPMDLALFHSEMISATLGGGSSSSNDDDANETTTIPTTNTNTIELTRMDEMCVENDELEFLFLSSPSSSSLPPPSRLSDRRTRHQSRNDDNDLFSADSNDGKGAVIPTADQHENNNDMSNNATTQESSMPKAQQQKQQPVADASSSSSSSTKDAPTVVTTAEHIRNLVRQYCSLPDSIRHFSRQAEEIEQLTGYSLIPPTVKKQKVNGIDLNWTASPKEDGQPSAVATATATAADHHYRALMFKLGHLVELIETQKQITCKIMQQCTGCRSERTKSGKYRYIHIATNQKISPASYEELYLAAMKEMRDKSRQRIQEFMVSFAYNTEPQQNPDPERKDECNMKAEPHLETNETNEEDEVDMSIYAPDTDNTLNTSSSPNTSTDDTIFDLSLDSAASASLETNEEANVKQSPTNLGEQQEEEEHVDVAVRSSEEDDTFEAASTSVTSTDGPTSDVSSDSDTNARAFPRVVPDEAVKSAHGNGVDATVEHVDKPPSPGSSIAKAMPKPAAVASSPFSAPENGALLDNEQDAPDESQELLLPLPSRDEASDDPKIAAAEARLWMAIDTALAAYSQEVIAIYEARKQTQQVLS